MVIHTIILTFIFVLYLFVDMVLFVVFEFVAGIAMKCLPPLDFSLDEMLLGLEAVTMFGWLL